MKKKNQRNNLKVVKGKIEIPHILRLLVICLYRCDIEVYVLLEHD